MTNERLRNAMTGARVDIDAIAAEAGVDPKTVQRWLSGRTPYARHRSTIAAMVGAEEDYLWPSARSVDLEAGEGDARAEILAAYPHRASAPQELWRRLLERSQRRIDVMGYAMLFLPEQHPDLASLIQERCAEGCQVRISLADPDGEQTKVRDELEGLNGTLPARITTTLMHFAPLRACPGVEMRLHDWHLYNAVYRFDDEMVVTPYLVATHGYRHPLLHLRRLGPYGLFEGYSAQFERLWEGALPLSSPEEVTV
ncbi:MAG: DUF5919 domain-containing protein [Egibacteraceae bacterium]